MRHTLSLAGPSVLFTSITNVVAFFVASTVPIEIVRLFCLQMGLTEILNFLSLLLIFLPLMVLDCHRTLVGRGDMGVVCCPKEQKLDCKDESALGRAAKNIWVPF